MLHRTEKIEITMLAVVVVAVAVSAIRPHSFAVWMTEIFWVAGLMAVLLSTRRMFRFSLAAYSCFFVWMMLQTVGAHYTFELVPMDWLKEMLGLVRNPYDRIAHFTVGWFAFPFAELFLRKGWVRSATLAAFFAVMTVVAMAGLWDLSNGSMPSSKAATRAWRSSVRRATHGTRRRTSSVTPSALSVP